MTKYEIQMIPTDDFGLFKDSKLIKVYCTRREAEAALAKIIKEDTQPDLAE